MFDVQFLTTMAATMVGLVSALPPRDMASRLRRFRSRLAARFQPARHRSLLPVENREEQRK